MATTKVTIQIEGDGFSLTLTQEQARELHEALGGVLGSKNQQPAPNPPSPYLPSPLAPYRPPQPLMPKQGDLPQPYKVWCVSGTPAVVAKVGS